MAKQENSLLASEYSLSGLVLGNLTLTGSAAQLGTGGGGDIWPQFCETGV